MSSSPWEVGDGIDGCGGGVGIVTGGGGEP
jgi:hypothetical protein